ncbi:hypothetical protein HYPSUDRAFT_47252 [Hypholoma sublateritium FD-334 SS-4]|uniref:Uncharacterized protein n=1 Tax=Hypholoma sublateritium (strain FD-334 SS-4) TaxID=945553 RepID=A0A0D2P845_HYPSF|nr:hypothetical protein HYPSUDRAFT_47252 [Hypholoma sublateritium FD-334 SS-4]
MKRRSALPRVRTARSDGPSSAWSLRGSPLIAAAFATWTSNRLILCGVLGVLLVDVRPYQCTATSISTVSPWTPCAAQLPCYWIIDLLGPARGDRRDALECACTSSP